MYVRPQNRGQEVAQKLLTQLESSAVNMGCQQLLLETGPFQPAALAFYEKQGFARRGPFGAYPEHPLSVFMGKRLASPQTGV
jgi:putative acetyltransferase